MAVADQPNVSLPGQAPGRVGWLPDLSRRAHVPERMDDPECDEAALLRTVEQFRWINRLTSRYPTLLGRWVIDDMRREPGRAYELLDLGAGGCDIGEWLLARSRRLGLRLSVTAVDADPRIVRWARTRHRKTRDLRIVGGDALEELRRRGPVDYVFANHFLHHLEEEAIVELLRRVASSTRRAYVLSDIRRSWGAWLGYTALSGALFRGSFAFEDGRASVRRGFTPGELHASIDRAGIAGARVLRLAPSRLAIIGPGRWGADGEGSAVDSLNTGPYHPPFRRSFRGSDLGGEQKWRSIGVSSRVSGWTRGAMRPIRKAPAPSAT